MTAHEFSNWLQGYLEGKIALDASEIEKIKQKAAEILPAPLSIAYPFPYPYYPYPYYNPLYVGTPCNPPYNPFFTPMCTTVGQNYVSSNCAVTFQDHQAMM